MDKVTHSLKNRVYEEGVTLITPTGSRPLAIQRAQTYIERQDYDGPLQWLICDDGEDHYTSEELTHPAIQHIKNKFTPNKAMSFTGNLLSSLPHIRFDKILIIEDDDWYASTYITNCIIRLQRAQLVGEALAHYYNVAHKLYRVCGNDKHASLCQTGFRAEILDRFYRCCLKRDSAFVDSRLWAMPGIKKFLPQDKFHCVGLKGLPGRGGIGAGHRVKGKKSFKEDNDFSILKAWIGPSDAQWYIDLYNKGMLV